MNEHVLKTTRMNINFNLCVFIKTFSNFLRELYKQDLMTDSFVNKIVLQMFYEYGLAPEYLRSLCYSFRILFSVAEVERID